MSDPLEAMFPKDETGKPKFDKLAWARNVLRREHNDTNTERIARHFLKEANQTAPSDKRRTPYEAYLAYHKRVVEEWWREQSLDVVTQLDRRFSKAVNPKRKAIHASAPPSSDHSFARFLLVGDVLNAAGLVAQRLVREPYGSMQIELLNDGYWDQLERRVRSSAHPVGLAQPKPVAPVDASPPARELSDSEVDALLPAVAPKAARGQDGAELERLRALFE